MKYLLIILIVFTSCTSQKKCLEKYPPVVSTDSVYIEKVKEIPVYLPGDSVFFETVITDCADQEILYENGTLKQTITILNGKLYSALKINPDTIKVPVIEIRETIKEVRVPQPVKYTPKYVKIFAYIGSVFSVLLIIFAFIKVKKLF